MGTSSLGLLLLRLVIIAIGSGSVFGYPSIYVARYQQTCAQHPSTDFGKVHEHTSTPDKTVAFSLRSASASKAVVQEKGMTRVCPGESYELEATFSAPSRRNYLLTATQGTFTVPQDDCDAWCPNRVCSVAPAAKATALYRVPCSIANGSKIVIKITSASGRIPTPGSTLRTATLSLVTSSSCSKCSKAVVYERAPASQNTSN